MKNKKHNIDHEKNNKFDNCLSNLKVIKSKPNKPNKQSK